MNTYQRIFGVGPLCTIMGVVLVVLFFYLGNFLDIPQIALSDAFVRVILITTIILTLLSFFWGMISLPTSKRGKEVIAKGAYAYVRHPLYASFLVFFVLGMGVYLKSYTVLVAWLLLLFICGKIVEKEEQLMVKEFGKKYQKYQKKTKKFIPWVY